MTIGDPNASTFESASLAWKSEIVLWRPMGVGTSSDWVNEVTTNASISDWVSETSNEYSAVVNRNTGLIPIVSSEITVPDWAVPP